MNTHATIKQQIVKNSIINYRNILMINNKICVGNYKGYSFKIPFASVKCDLGKQSLQMLSGIN